MLAGARGLVCPTRSVVAKRRRRTTRRNTTAPRFRRSRAGRPGSRPGPPRASQPRRRRGRWRGRRPDIASSRRPPRDRGPALGTASLASPTRPWRGRWRRQRPRCRPSLAPAVAPGLGPAVAPGLGPAVASRPPAASRHALRSRQPQKLMRFAWLVRLVWRSRVYLGQLCTRNDHFSGLVTGHKWSYGVQSEPRYRVDYPKRGACGQSGRCWVRWLELKVGERGAGLMAAGS